MDGAPVELGRSLLVHGIALATAAAVAHYRHATVALGAGGGAGVESGLGSPGRQEWIRGNHVQELQRHLRARLAGKLVAPVRQQLIQPFRPAQCVLRLPGNAVQKVLHPAFLLRT